MTEIQEDEKTFHIGPFTIVFPAITGPINASSARYAEAQGKITPEEAQRIIDAERLERAASRARSRRS